MALAAAGHEVVSSGRTFGGSSGEGRHDVAGVPVSHQTDAPGTSPVPSAKTTSPGLRGSSHPLSG